MRIRLLLVLISACLLATTSVQAQTTQTSATLYIPLAAKADVPTSNQPLRSGDATYYIEADGGGNCSFPTTPGDLMVGAMNQVDYNNAALCGAYVAMSGPNGSITIRIVDRCPECKPGDIDLSPQAFDRIAERAKGRVQITWRIISPDIAGPIRYYHKDGTNKWWTAIQIRNHRNPIAKVEYRKSNGSYAAMVRQEYNFWLAIENGNAIGLGDGPYILHVTDIYGNALVDSVPFVGEKTEVSGVGQFPKTP